MGSPLTDDTAVYNGIARDLKPRHLTPPKSDVHYTAARLYVRVSRDTSQPFRAIFLLFPDMKHFLHTRVADMSIRRRVSGSTAPTNNASIQPVSVPQVSSQRPHAGSTKTEVLYRFGVAIKCFSSSFGGDVVPELV